MLVQLVQGCWVTNIDIGQGVNAGVGIGVADAAQFIDDLRLRLQQLAFTARAQQHPGAGNGQVATQLQANAQAAAGNHRSLALVQARKHPHQRSGHGPFTRGSLDVLGYPEVDRVHLPDPVGQGRSPVRSKGKGVPVLCVVPNQLVGLHRPGQLPGAGQGVVLVAPAPYQRFVGRSDDLVEQIAVTVTGVRDVGNGRWLALAEPAAQVGGEGRGEGDGGYHLVPDEIFHIFIGGGADRVAVLPVLFLGQHDDTVQAAKVVVDELHGPVHRFPAQGVQVRQLHGVQIPGLDDGAGVADGLQVAEGQQHPCATFCVPLRKGDGFLVVGASQDQHNIVRQVFQALVGPGHQLRAALGWHLHAIGNLHVVP